MIINNLPDVIITGEGSGNLFGVTVNSASDVNGDGFSDFLVAATGYEIFSGKGYIYYGGTNMNTDADIVMTGEINSNFGRSASSSGDINGDGFSEVVFGAPQYNNKTGRASIFFGTTSDIKLNLRLIEEGMYYPVFNQLVRKDSVKVFLRDMNSPYHIRDSAISQIDSLSLSGLFTFSTAPTGTYYVIAKHFNSLETWSKVGGEYLIADASINNYDFTTSISQAFGNNLKLKGSKFCFFSGDLNNDGVINLTDIIPIYVLASHFTVGNYLPEDLTGDNIVDLNDVLICYNNSASFVKFMRP